MSKPEKPRREFDWSSLPASARGLIPYFEKYGGIQTNDQIVAFYKTMTSAQREELLTLFKLYWPLEEELRAWRQGYNWREHQEAPWVYFACGLAADVHYRFGEKADDA